MLLDKMLDKMRDNAARIFAMEDETLQRAIEAAIVRAGVEQDADDLGFILGVLASRPETMPQGGSRRAIFDEALAQAHALHPVVLEALADQVDAMRESLRRVDASVTSTNLFREWLWKHALRSDKSPGVSFSVALEALKAGKRVARAGWNGKGMWLVLIKPGNAMHTSSAGSFDMQPCIGMKTAQNTMQPGWLASQTDMFAEDWEIVGAHG